MKSDHFKFMIVAGEASGDELAAKLISEIRRIVPEVEFFGTVGPRMRELGVESIFDSDKWSITGILPVALAIPQFLRALRVLKRTAAERKPDAVILIDFPEFNLKLARHLKQRGQTVIYYVSPQLWAWRKYRIRAIRKYVDLLISILPFEPEWYAANGVDNVEFVGNPIIENISPATNKTEFCLKHGLDQAGRLIALLPGSRKREIRYHLPPMIESAIKMVKDWPDLQFVIAIPPNISFDQTREALAEFSPHGEIGKVIIVQNETFEALNAADAAAVASGTATLEAGIIGTPMAIVYRMSKLDGMILRPFVKAEFIGLINLVAGRCVAKELVQDDFTSDNLSAELFRLLDPATNTLVRRELASASASLLQGASKKSAGSIIRFVNKLKDPRPELP